MGRDPKQVSRPGLTASRRSGAKADAFRKQSFSSYMRPFFIGLVGAGFGLAIIPLVSVFFPNSDISDDLVAEPDSSLDERVKLLSSEISRVQNYEEELKNKADAIEAVLREIDGLNTQPLVQSIGATGGQGGSVEPLVPLAKEENSFSVFGKFLKKDEKASLLEDLGRKTDLLIELPLGKPTDGGLTSGFGYRKSPFTGRMAMHKGVDLSGPMRGEVYATAPGKVKQAGYRAGYGKTVVIRHKSGFETLYGHLQKVTVQAGETVCRGEEIGQLGSTGRSTGPHLHYEVRQNGIAKNPLPFVELSRYVSLVN